MSNFKTPPEVTDYIGEAGGTPVGMTKRLRHDYRTNGSECSLRKDSCLIVSRRPNHWYWYCHRCHEYGHVPLSGMSPRETVKMVKQKTQPAIKATHFGVFLPDDLVNIQDESVPRAAIKWLQQYDITPVDCDDHEIAWSPFYRRIIFPIYDLYDVLKLVGWAGRCIDLMSKSERQKKHRPKWLHRKDHACDRIFFSCQADSRVIVYTEDIPSAIKVHKHTGKRTIAILNSTLPYDVVEENKDMRQLVWLDSDVFQDTMKSVRRYISFGYDMSAIHTQKDPKEIDRRMIQSKIEALTL